MTLVPVVIVLVRRADDQARRSMFVYLAITHLGGVALWLAVLLAGDASAGRQSVVALLAVVGCAAKAGLVPLHVWLPRAHPIAPPHISALMSGVMVKVALYVLARFLLEWTPLASDAAAIVVIVLGAVSGVVGGIYAVLQADLKRLLAFSTVENVGVDRPGARCGHPAGARRATTRPPGSRWAPRCSTPPRMRRRRRSRSSPSVRSTAMRAASA